MFCIGTERASQSMHLNEYICVQVIMCYYCHCCIYLLDLLLSEESVSRGRLRQRGRGRVTGRGMCKQLFSGQKVLYSLVSKIQYFTPHNII